MEQAADELYELPLGDFTRARDERAKALRKEGRRDEADAVKALRKPTLAAWALNQLARRRPKEVEGLLTAGEKLRAAQEELLAGGDRKAFQSAAAKERDEVAALAAETAGLAAEAGERASPGLEEKVAATLHAAALDEETGEQLRAGRLLREREAIGGFGAITAAAPAVGRDTKAARPKAAAATPKRGKSRAKASDDAKPRKTADRRQAAQSRGGQAARGGRAAPAAGRRAHRRAARAARARGRREGDPARRDPRRGSSHACRGGQQASGDDGSSFEGGPARGGGCQEGTRSRRACARGCRARVLGTRRPGGVLTRTRSRAACRSPGRR